MSFVKARELLRIAEMAKARYRGVSLRDIMSELSVNERTARRMARELEDLCPKVLITEDEERRRYWKLAQVPFIDHRVVHEKELSALDLAIRRAARDGAENEVAALQSIRDHLVASVPRVHARSAEVSSEIMMLANGFACRPGPATRIQKQHLEALFNALVHPSMIEITYTSARNPEPRTKRVEPHGVIVGTRHYLVARDGSDDRQFKQYRLDRISKSKAPQRSSRETLISTLRPTAPSLSAHTFPRRNMASCAGASPRARRQWRASLCFIQHRS